MCFIVAFSEGRALEAGNEVAEQFVQLLYGKNAYSWKEFGVSGWIEDGIDDVEWALANNVPVFDATAAIDFYECAAQLVKWANCSQ